MMKGIRVNFIFLLAMFLLVPIQALAGSASLSWQPNSESDLTGYRVYYGAASRTYGPPISVNQGSSYTVNDLQEGDTFFFAVTAVDSSGNESGYSNEVSKTIPQATPSAYQLTLSRSSDRSNPVPLSAQTVSGDVYIFVAPEESISQVVFSIDGTSVQTESLAPYDLAGTNGGSAYPYDTHQLSDGTHEASASIRFSDGTVQNLTAAFTVSNNASAPADTTAPQISVSSPTTGNSYATDTATIAVSGTASDNSGVVRVTWNNDRGGSGTASGTSTWTASGIQLSEGENTLTFSAEDASGNVGRYTLSVTRTVSDPTVSTYQLTLSRSSDRSNPVSLSNQTISDGVYVFVTPEDNISQVVFSIDGQQYRTENYAPYDLGEPFDTSALNDGSHTISALVRLQDGTQQTISAVCSVANGTTASDSSAPQITVTSPTYSSTYQTGATTLTVNGTATDNVGVVRVTWTNNRGGSGTASGTGSWSVAGIQLQEGENRLVFTAVDAANNTGQTTLTVTRTTADTVAPTVQITSPTTNSSYSAGWSSRVDLSGTASDNVGVTRVTWQNSNGQSGTASGTGNWSVNDIPLDRGTNTITITAFDSEGNSGTDTLTVTRSSWW